MRVLRRFKTKIMWVRSCIIAPPFIDGWIFVCKLLLIIIGAVIHSGDGSDLQTNIHPSMKGGG